MIDKLDITTLISFYPLPLMEEKPGMYPGKFSIEASDGVTPALAYIGQSNHYVDVGEDRPQLEVAMPSFDIARAIVDDFIAAQLAISDNAAPGLGYVRGKLTLAEVKAKEGPLLLALKERQRLWYMALVKLGDDDWQRYHKHVVISDVQRIGARALGLERDWVMIPEEVNAPTCPACGTQVAPSVVVCSNCRCILDKDKYALLSFAK